MRASFGGISICIRPLLAGALLGACAPTVAQSADDALAHPAGHLVLARLTDVIEDRVGDTLTRRVESAVEQRLEDRIERRVAEQAERRTELQVDQALPLAVEADAELPRDVEALPRSLDRTVEALRAATDDVARGLFVAADDDDGRPIERSVWVMLLPSEHVARLDDWGFNVREQRALDALDLVLVRFDAPEGRALAQVALEVALDAPGAVVDYNHVYRTQRAEAGAAGTCRATPVRHEPLPVADHAAGLSIGMIDSRVDASHPALAGARIEQRDFVRRPLAQPADHGTAIASILVARGALSGLIPHAALYTAAVFFDAGEGHTAATAESLVEALSWLSETGTPVINMSLAGPPNRLLAVAIDRLTAAGIVVVAAVGNNGPAGEPLFPAAYASVVGVTAVDACHRIYRYANRGPQVTFSGLGVDIEVAGAEGGYVVESGTSMAAAQVAALVANAVADAATPAAVLETLKLSALDLGEPGFNPIFGHGLVGARQAVARQ